MGLRAAPNNERQAAPNKINLRRTMSSDRSGLENLPDERPFLRRRFLSDEIIFSDQSLSVGKPSISIVANRGQGFAFFDAIADALVKSQSDGVVDGIFLFFAAAAENGQGDAELLAVGARDIAGRLAENLDLRARRLQSLWFINNAVITALLANSLLEFFLGSAAGDHGFGEAAALFDALGTFAEVEHPCG